VDNVIIRVLTRWYLLIYCVTILRKVTRKGGIVERIGICAIVFSQLLCLSGLYGARPFATDDAGTVELGVHELECGIDFWSEDAVFGLGFKHGLTERMDLGVGVSYVIAPEESNGFEIAELGVKFALIPDVFSASLTGSFGDAAYTLNGIITQGVGPLEVDGNFGYEATGISGEEGTIIYALAVIFNAESFAFGVEGAGDEDGLQSWLVGGRYSLLDGLALDAGIAGGFEEDADMNATAGVHYEF
jgi:hypothetical protein